MRTLAIALLAVMVFSLPAAAVKQGTSAKLTIQSPKLTSTKKVEQTKTITKAPAKVTVQPMVAEQNPAPAPVVEKPTIPDYPVGCQQYLPLVQQYNWDTSVAMAIMQAESSDSKGACDANAVSATDDYGLFQINHGLEIYGTKIYDPSFNVSIAYNIKYLGNKWYPWTTYTSGVYLRYLR